MDEAKSAGLTPVQFCALIAISDRPGVDAKRVSDLIFFDPSTIGSVLERLEKRGLISRKPGLEDKRTKRLFLTTEGAVVIEKIKKRMPAISRRILAPLQVREQRLLVSLLSRLVGATEPAERKKRSS
jgi:DNA-binding MarR family transcriptional regulator